MAKHILDYAEAYGDGFPSIASFPRKKLPAGIKNDLLRYLRDPSFGTWSTYGKPLTDVFTGRPLHTWGNYSTDGEYEWTDDLPEYVDKYDIEIPDELVFRLLWV